MTNEIPDVVTSNQELVPFDKLGMLSLTLTFRTATGQEHTLSHTVYSDKIVDEIVEQQDEEWKAFTDYIDEVFA